MAYTPPAGNSANFDLKTYTVVSGNVVSFEMQEPSGPANLKSLDTNLLANIKSIDTNLIANVKTYDTII